MFQDWSGILNKLRLCIRRGAGPKNVPSFVNDIRAVAIRLNVHVHKQLHVVAVSVATLLTRELHLRSCFNTFLPYVR